MDQQLKERMKELGEAINKSLSDSAPISEVVARIKQDGYDIFLTLEATIGVSKKGEEISDKGSAVMSFPFGPESERWMGQNVKIGSTRPDGTPHPNAGKTGKVRRLLPLDAHMRAVVDVENDFIVVSLKSLEALPQTHDELLSD